MKSSCTDSEERGRLLHRVANGMQSRVRQRVERTAEIGRERRSVTGRAVCNGTMLMMTMRYMKFVFSYMTTLENINKQ